MTELQNKALRKTFYLVQSEIPDKYVEALHQYIKSLTDCELERYNIIAQQLYDRKTIRGASWKVSCNAIKLCIKLSEQNVHVFPFVEKIATRGWNTSGGTYCFSMPILTNDTVNNSIFSFNDVQTLAATKSKIQVYYNEHSRSQEVDLKPNN